ncbi:MAG TPA: hypothetical protein VGD40_10655 [Chryseosolibacter sp.]
MNLKYLKYYSSCAILCAVLVGCESEYSRQVKAELAKNVRQDSVLLGINLGHTRNDFYGRCFDLNKQHIVSQGPNGNSVQYYFTDSIVHQPPQKLRLLFAPNFDASDHIAELQVELSYVGWAPWNKDLQSDSLKVRTVELLEKWYGGNKFIMVDMDDREIPVKVDGNRRIIVDAKDAQNVRIRFQDLLNPAFQHSITKEAIESNAK